MATSEQSAAPITDRTRRGFLKSTATTVAGAAVASRATPALAEAGFGNREIKVGLIGCGGRGTGAVIQIMNGEGPIRLVAMADAFDYRLNDGLGRIEKHAAELSEKTVDVPEARRHTGLDGYQRVLESDCDVVVLATPPGFRPTQFEAAIEAGKHVFSEKPMAVDAPGVRRVLTAGKKAEERGLAVQIGLQRHHEPRYQETIQRIHDGAIGDLVLSRVYWNSGGVWVRPRKPEQTEMQYQVDNWYYFNWTCGGQIVEQHIHNLDIANWVHQATPIEAQGQGGREVRSSKETGQIFDHHSVEYTYPNGAKLLSCCRHIPGAWGQVGEFAHGTRGTADVSGGKIYGPDGELVWRHRGRRVQGHQQEQLNFVQALRAGDTPNETEYGALSTMTAIMGRMATHSGKLIKWEEAINSDLDVGPTSLAWDATPPVLPDDEGRYPVPKPGKATVL